MIHIIRFLTIKQKVNISKLKYILVEVKFQKLFKLIRNAFEIGLSNCIITGCPKKNAGKIILI